MVAPCAACKFRKKGCTSECAFAPYFPAENPTRFETVNRVFGASKVSNFINNLHLSQRNEAIDSLSYEAEQRIRDPVFGCVSQLTVLQSDLARFQHEIAMLKKEIDAYGKQPINPSQAAHDDIASQMLNPVTAAVPRRPSSSQILSSKRLT